LKEVRATVYRAHTKGEADMFWFCAALSAAGVLESVLCSFLVAEFAGYWLHRLLHTDRLPFLSRSHMAHHLLLYGPLQPMRAESYKDSTSRRISLGNIGLEWLIPSAVVLIICWGVMLLLGVLPIYQVIVLGTLLVWPFFSFSLLHDAMHLCDFWMARTPLINRWFRKARRLHDIHHHSLDNAGHMNANFGIGFFLFDRIFKTLVKSHRPVNRKGLEIALRHYKLITPLYPVGRESTGEGKAAFQ
jgi:sterol desaturase/sphingolipid hydroxylase (fatty acid hydroxylase superfamily)